MKSLEGREDCDSVHLDTSDAPFSQHRAELATLFDAADEVGLDQDDLGLVLGGNPCRLHEVTTRAREEYAARA